jgi:hypothetical protein
MKHADRRMDKDHSFLVFLFHAPRSMTLHIASQVFLTYYKYSSIVRNIRQVLSLTELNTRLLLNSHKGLTTIISPLFLLWKNERGLWDHHAVCVYLPPPSKFLMPELIFMKLGVYVMAPDPTSAA